jgi:ABC-2 type transport system ATP-binding protein
MIEVKNLVKHFGETKAVDGVSFDSSPEQGIFGLLGPNGAGKTTIIRMLMNIIAPDSGMILFNGKEFTEDDKNLIGYLPEERGLYPNFKVGEILTYFAQLKGKNPKSIQDNIDFWLDRFDLLDYKDKEVSSLSKGMAQKVQFICSIVHDPKLIFLDEPFSGFDPVSTDLLRENIIELGRQGKNILFSTHIMEQAEKICSEIFIINKGKEVISGNLSDIKKQYGSNSVIVEFDGDGSFIENLDFVDNVLKYPRYMEVNLKKGAEANQLFKSIAGKINVSRFESKTSSLHNVFVTLVGTDKGLGKDNEYIGQEGKSR